MLVWQAETLHLKVGRCAWKEGVSERTWRQTSLTSDARDMSAQSRSGRTFRTLTSSAAATWARSNRGSTREGRCGEASSSTGSPTGFPLDPLPSSSLHKPLHFTTSWPTSVLRGLVAFTCAPYFQATHGSGDKLTEGLALQHGALRRRHLVQSPHCLDERPTNCGWRLSALTAACRVPAAHAAHARESRAKECAAWHKH